MHRADDAVRPRVLLFTEAFPAVGDHEPFVAVEVEQLARRLDLVLIPTTWDGGPVSELPPGVVCDTGLAEHMAARRPRVAGLLRALAFGGTYREIAAFRGRALDPRVAAAVVVRASRMFRAQAWTRRYLGTAGNVVAYSWWSSMAGYGVARAAKHHGRSCVARIHGYELYPEQDRLSRIPFQGIGLAGFDAVYSVSRAGADYLKEAYPDLASMIHVAYLGVDAPPGIGRPSTDGTFRILSCSSLIPIKRVELLASGIAALTRDHPDLSVSWTHVGDGPSRGDVQRIIDAEDGLAERVTFTGLLPPSTVRALMVDGPWDAFINVSSSEGLPVTLMEAASSSIPLIATAIGGSPEIVDQTCGRLLPANPNPGQVAAALAELARMAPEQRHAMRRASHDRWASRFSANVNYATFADILAALADS